MKIDRQIRKQLGSAKKKLHSAGKAARHAGKAAKGVSKAVWASAAGIVLMIGNVGSTIRDRIADMSGFSKKKKSGEVLTVKKSTVVALLVALAAVAGVLGALYVYVLRREKELDEYEQLLFSEEFDENDDDDLEELEAPKTQAKTAKTEG